MVIQPPQQIIGWEFENADPGVYRAKLHTTRRYQKGDHTCIRCEWELLSYPDKNNTYRVQSFYGISKPGFLAKMLGSWKRLVWKNVRDLVQGPHNPIPERFTGDEADVVVRAYNHYNGSTKTRVEVVAPPGTYVVQTEDGSFVPRPEAANVV